MGRENPYDAGSHGEMSFLRQTSLITADTRKLALENGGNVATGQVTAVVGVSLDGFISRIGAVITGRRTFDIARAWEAREKSPAPRSSSPTESPAPSGRSWPPPGAGMSASWEPQSSASACKPAC
jgi:hypothetical protein